MASLPKEDSLINYYMRLAYSNVKGCPLPPRHLRYARPCEGMRQPALENIAVRCKGSGVLEPWLASGSTSAELRSL